MNFFKNALTLVFAVLLFTACKNEKKPEIKTVETATTSINEETIQLDPNATYAKNEFSISGMTCAVGCAKKIEGKLAKLEGVKSAKVDFDRKLAMVEYDVAKVTPESLTTTVTKISETYKVSDIKTVDAFSVKQCKGKCKEDCKSAKKGCKNKDKIACLKDCKKPCCAKA